MSDEPPPESASPAQKPDAEEPQAEEPPFILEGARSSRSRCKLCRKKIDQGALRLGTLIEGPFGRGYIWEHLKCAAGRSFAKVEQAYGLRAWEHAKEPPGDLPDLGELALLKEEADVRRAQRRELPYVELAPSGRSRCKHSGELIEKGAARVVLGREVEFGNQVRTTPINVLPEHVASAVREPDCATPAEGLFEALSANSRDLDPALLEEVTQRIGEL